MRSAEEWAALDADLETLYRRAGGGTLSDPEWLRVDRTLLEYARASVRKCCHRYRIPEHTTAELAEDVRVRLIQKFLERKFDGSRSLSFVIRVAAFREVITRLRRVKSPRACGIGERDPVSTAPPAAPERDLFLEVRARCGTFRFEGMGLARDALLAARLQTGQYPGAGFLRGLVPEALRKICHVASVVSINRALGELVVAGAEDHS